MHIKINNNFLSYNNYKVKCSVGKRGIGNKKNEGDLITPKGLFKIKYILFRKDRIKKIKTIFKKIIIKKNMGWCDDPNSTHYNKLIRFPFKWSSEKLYRKDNIYDIILVLNYNMEPIRKNKGSAIFVHVAKNRFSPTKGCVAIKKSELLKLLKCLKKNTRIKIY